MVTHSFYESDNRVLRYAESLAERGDHVDVLALRRSASLPRTETINGVQLHRIQDRFAKGEGSLWSYLWPLLRFSAVSLNWLAAPRKDRQYDLVHVHNIPDFLIFSAWPARLRGSRLLLDIHDIVPEFFASKFNADEQSCLVRGLKLMERASGELCRPRDPRQRSVATEVHGSFRGGQQVLGVHQLRRRKRIQAARAPTAVPRSADRLSRGTPVAPGTGHRDPRIQPTGPRPADSALSHLRRRQRQGRPAWHSCSSSA